MTQQVIHPAQGLIWEAHRNVQNKNPDWGSQRNPRDPRVAEPIRAEVSSHPQRNFDGY